jgi:P27 family predicted phage terminase small subunit
MRGRKPKPTKLKELAGNPGKRRIPPGEPKPEGNLREPPEWMTDSQRAGWVYALEHAPRSLLKKIDRSALAIWVCAEDYHRQANQEQAALGRLLVKTEKNGVTVQSPYLPIINKQAQVMLKAAEQLGFTPAARPRIATGVTPTLNNDDERETESEAGGPEGEGDLGSYLARNPARLN